MQRLKLFNVRGKFYSGGCSGHVGRSHHHRSEFEAGARNTIAADVRCWIATVADSESAPAGMIGPALTKHETCFVSSSIPYDPDLFCSKYMLEELIIFNASKTNEVNSFVREVMKSIVEFQFGKHARLLLHTGAYGNLFLKSEFRPFPIRVLLCFLKY